MATARCAADTIGKLFVKVCMYQRDRKDLEKDNTKLRRNIAAESRRAKNAELKIA